MEDEKNYCTNCGTEMVQNAAFCMSCGVSKGKSKKYCINCGNTVNEEQEFCTKCGTKLNTSLDFSKGKEVLQKVTQTTIEGTNTLAKVASEKTGTKIKASWLVGGVLLVALIIFFMIPKGLSGTYTQTTTFLGIQNESSIRFKGNHYVEVDNEENKGTYKIQDQKIILTPDGSKTSISGTLAKDKKSFKLMGMTYNKND